MQRGCSLPRWNGLLILIWESFGSFGVVEDVDFWSHIVAARSWDILLTF